MQSVSHAGSSNAHVLKVDDFWLENNGGRNVSHAFIKMELCHGTLQEYLDQLRSTGHSIDIQELVEITCHILSGLCHCHSHRVCHRDLKPSNSKYPASPIWLTHSSISPGFMRLSSHSATSIETLGPIGFRILYYFSKQERNILSPREGNTCLPCP